MLLIDSFSDFGGAERLVGHIAHGLDRSRFEPVVCATRAADPASAAAAAAAGVRVVELGRERTLSPAAWARLWRELRDGVDVLHAHKFGSNVWGSLLGRAARVPVVIAHEHTWSFEGAPMRKLVDGRLIAPLVDAFVAVSRDDARRMTELEGIDPELIRVVPNGIPAQPAPMGHDVRAELAIDPDAPLLGSVSVLRRQKAIDVLLRAAAQLREHEPRLHVLVVGDGPERARLEALAAELGLGASVTFAGRRDDVADVFAALDVLVAPSDFEGSPLALIEAMAAGKAIVATRVGGVPDLIEDGVHGLLVPPRRPDAVADAVRRLLDDPSTRERLGRQAAERQRSELTIEATVSRLEQLYETLFLGTGRH
jgi:glycosyltransferase involved in cell wall biosynthesis